MRLKRLPFPRLRRAAAGWIAVSVVTGALAVTARAADWPVWRGPARDGVSTESGYLTRWPAGGPKKLWTARVGEGYSAVSVAGGRACTAGSSGSQDTVYCLDA